MRIADPRDILIAPVISEKSYSLLDENKYTFLVAPDANKTQIKIAVQDVFGVKVTSVNTHNREGKRLRTRTGFGRRAVGSQGSTLAAPSIGCAVRSGTMASGKCVGSAQPHRN